MNVRLIVNTLGKVMLIEVCFMFWAFVVSLVYRENCAYAFGITMVIASIVGLLAMFLSKPKVKDTFVKEGIIIVVFAWIIMSMVGAVPFVISGEIKNPIDAFFETVSGFTTTGSSIVPNVEVLSKGILFWRSLTHWVGGMGVLVFILAVTGRRAQDKSINILRAEMAGPSVDKIHPKADVTARILYVLYLLFTIIEVFFLILGKMPLYDALIHTFGSAGTGGFGIKADGMASYSSYCQWVVTISMFLFGVCFNIYYFLTVRKFKTVLKSNELWTYLGVFIVFTALISANIYKIYGTISDSVRLAAFQVSSIVTTTGFSTANFDLWPQFSKVLLFILMFLGGCAGSTAGGLKISRVVVLFQSIKNDLKRNVKPRSIKRIILNGKVVDSDMEKGILNYFALYCLVLVVCIILVSIDNFDFETNISAVVSCVNNIGPGFGAVGPASNFSGYGNFSTFVLSIAMLLGRLELYPIIVMMSIDFWAQKNK